MLRVFFPWATPAAMMTWDSPTSLGLTPELYEGTATKSWMAGFERRCEIVSWPFIPMVLGAWCELGWYMFRKWGAKGCWWLVVSKTFERSPFIGNSEMIQMFDSTIAMTGLPQRYTNSFFHGIDTWCLSTSMLFTLYAYLPSKNSSKLVNHMAKLFDSVISRDYEIDFCLDLHPGRLTWNLQIAHFFEGKWSEPNLQGIMEPSR